MACVALSGNTADRATVIRHLMEGQYDPVRIVAFNTSQGWSRDVDDTVHAEESALSRVDGDLSGVTLYSSLELLKSARERR